MTPEHAIESMLAEMGKNKYFFKKWQNQVRRYLYMSYGIGFNEGKCLRFKKPVIRMNQYGNEVVQYESAAQAARLNNIKIQGINHVCKGKGHLAGGYLWKYAENQPLTASQENQLFTILQESQSLKTIQTNEDITDPDIEKRTRE